MKRAVLSRLFSPHALLPAILAAIALTAPPAEAAPRRIDALADMMKLGGILEVMEAEGIDYGAEVQEELFPGRGGSTWDALVRRLYDAGTLDTIVRDRLEAEMQGVDLAPLEEFFGSPLGQRIVTLEVSAREAMLDEDVDEAAREAAARREEEDPERHALIRRFAEVNDLMETNTAGAMNASFAFYQGLAEGGAFGDTLTQEQMLSDVWSQEADIRAETEEWVMAYLGLAYAPLSDAEVEEYIEVSATDPGQALNRGLFAAFDEMYVTISRGLGMGSALFLAGSDL